MKKITLITHPEVIIDPNTPADEWVLSEKGLQRSIELSRSEIWKDIEKIYSSTEPKASHLAEVISKENHIILEKRRDLKEINRSATGFLPYNEFMDGISWFYQNPDQSFRGWEKADDAIKRIKNETANIAQNSKEENIALVGHAVIFSLLLCSLKNIPPIQILCPNELGMICEIDWHKKQFSEWKAY